MAFRQIPEVRLKLLRPSLRLLDPASHLRMCFYRMRQVTRALELSNKLTLDLPKSGPPCYGRRTLSAASDARFTKIGTPLLWPLCALGSLRHSIYPNRDLLIMAAARSRQSFLSNKVHPPLHGDPFRDLHEARPIGLSLGPTVFRDGPPERVP